MTLYRLVFVNLRNLDFRYDCGPWNPDLERIHWWRRFFINYDIPAKIIRIQKLDDSGQKPFFLDEDSDGPSTPRGPSLSKDDVTLARALSSMA